MKKHAKQFLGMVTATAITLSSVTAFAAPTYKDVASTHWAYDSIARMADKGYLVAGDAQGNYFPTLIIDKFFAASTIAKAAGFSYIDPTAEEKTFMDKAYEKHKKLLAGLKTKYPKMWDTKYDKEIAFLLEKKILTENDLNTFVYKNGTAEKKYALTREQACVLLVKLMSKQDEALKKSYKTLFSDDKDISAEAKPYVYYMRDANIVAGYENGTFEPKGTVTKAAFSVMLDKTITAMENGATPVTDYEIKTSYGEIETVFQTLSAVQIIDANGTKNIYTITGDTTVSVGGSKAGISLLKQGMDVKYIVNEATRELVDIKAEVTEQQTTTQEPTTASQPEQKPVLRTITATVNGAPTEKNISFVVKFVNARGEIVAQAETYEYASNVVMTRGANNMKYSDILNGETVTASVSNGIVYKIEVEEKDVKMTGKLVAKNNDAGQTIVVEDAKGIKKTFKVNSNSQITRKDAGAVAWSSLRVGDSVTVEAEYDVVKKMNAVGTKSTIEGKVVALYLSETTNQVTILDSATNKRNTYVIASGVYQVNDFAIGNVLSCDLDSEEVTRIVVKKGKTPENGTWEVTQNAVSTYFYVKDINGNAKKILIDSNTVVIDAETGRTGTYRDILSGVKVYVVFSTSKSTVAKTVTVFAE